MFTAFIELILWIIVTFVFLASKQIDWNTVYIGWTIAVAAIALVSVYKDKNN